MRALVFHDVGDIRLDDVPKPKIQDPTDAVVKNYYQCNLWHGFTFCTWHSRSDEKRHDIGTRSSRSS